MSVDVQAGAVTRITLNVPQTRNALSLAVLGQLAQAVRDAAHDRQTRVVVLAGSGGLFSSGANLKESATAEESAVAVKAVYDAIADAPVPVIARVDGHCLGLAVGIAAACDLVLTTPQTAFALPEPQFGQAPTLAAVTVLRRVQRGAASRLLLIGSPIDGMAARDVGLADDCVPIASMDSVIDTWCQQIGNGAPGAITVCKQLVRDLVPDEPARAFALAIDLAKERESSQEPAEAAAARREGRPPTWISAFSLQTGAVDD